MTRLSKPIEQLRENYEIVVIGSGYGGSIAANRLARAGRQVCLLERGREFIAGEYPATELEGAREMQFNTAEGHIGSRLGLFEVHVNPDLNAVVGCGLGGTSLINANVSLTPDPRLWSDVRWPIGLRSDLQTRLKDGYRRASEMLQPTPLPEDFAELPKLNALRDSAIELGFAERFYRPPINVTFKDGPNRVGVEQRCCIGCGDCVSGCNHRAKNTTLMNYLPDAVDHGAEIFTGVDVRSVARRDDKWVVKYQIVGVGREQFDAPELFLAADIVILSAGAIGSPALLLRSRSCGLPTSDQVGKRFTGNGDVLAFAFDTDRAINGVGFGTRSAADIPPVGPCITGIIDHRDTLQVIDGFVIEEGSLPGAIGAILPEALAVAAAAVGDEVKPSFSEWLHERARVAASIVRGPYHGAVHNTQTYLVMAHDDEAGEIDVVDGRPRIKWPGVGSLPIFEKINQTLQRATKVLGGEYVRNPIWSKVLGKELVTVHPLGGCPMGEDANSGVVDHGGRVFSGAMGSAVHQGLYVLDGSIMPLSLGVNPLLTISALAERGCALIAEERGWTIDYSFRQPAPSFDGHIGLRFTETMRGFFSVVEKTDYAAAEARGRADDSEMQFTLTIASADLESLLSNQAHEAAMIGTVKCPALSDMPLTVSHGRFNLFIHVPDEVDTRHMRYRMTLNAIDGKTYFFCGVKVINDGNIADVWPQTTTLYVTVSESELDDAPVVGQGILRITPGDFLKQLHTIDVLNAPNANARLKAITRFGKFFASVLYDSYGGVFAPERIFNPDAPPRLKRPLRVCAPDSHPFVTEDGVTLRLTRYRGGSKGPVMLIHGAGVSSLIFSTDLIDTNLLEFLYAHGYDVWLLDFRVSIDLPSAALPSTADDVARFDHFAAVAEVRRLTGVRDIQVVAHCYGATTFTMSMLAGVTNIRSAVLSQVSTHLILNPLGRLKVGLHTPQVLDLLGARTLTAYRDQHADWQQRLLDIALRFYPIRHGEDCRSAVCHRIAFMYALLYEHERLNERLHDNLHELFGVASVKLFEHLALMGRVGHVVSADGRDVYLPHLDRMAIPIALIHGAENQCFIPQSTEITYKLLCERNGAELYERHLIPGYGHIDCIFGKTAVDDVYPHILAHLEKTAILR